MQADAARRVDAWLKDEVKTRVAEPGWEIGLKRELAALQLIDFIGKAGLAQR